MGLWERRWRRGWDGWSLKDSIVEESFVVAKMILWSIFILRLTCSKRMNAVGAA